MESTELVSEQSTAGRRTMSSLAVLLGRIAARAAQNYVGNCLEDWTASTPKLTSQLTEQSDER